MRQQRDTARLSKEVLDKQMSPAFLQNDYPTGLDFRLLFESSPNPYLVLRPDPPKYTMVAVNDSYLSATGTQCEEILGLGLFEVFPDNPSDPSATGVGDLHTSLDRVIQERTQDVMGIQKYDIPRRGPGESGFEVKYWSPVNTPVFDKQGAIAYIIHRVEDVTEFILLREQSSQEATRIEKVQAKADRMEAEVLQRAREVKEANRQLKAANDELERREQELTRLNERLQELDRAKTAFFSNVSHEFRTPLTLMLGPIEDVLHEPNITPDNHEQLDIAYRNALRLLKLVNNLLDFARIEAGRAQATFEPTDISTLTCELASMFTSAMNKADLRLTMDCQPLPEFVYVDRDMWEKIVLNLLSNAFKHTFLGEIAVRLRWKQDQVELTVQDTGVGIPQEQLPHVFERFHRVPNAKSRNYEGSGIGLALVSELVKLHSGTIAVDSVVDQGTTFTVAIPTGKTHLPVERIKQSTDSVLSTLTTQPFVEEALRWLPQEQKQAARHKAQVWRKPDGQRVRILLADDNADMRNYVSRLLEQHSEVEMVSDGEAALDAARQNPPDLILSDIMMPIIDGFSLLSALRREPTLKAIPVILLSARAGEEARVEGLQAGADDYLVKPFNAQELLARVKANLNLELQQAYQEAEEARQISEERFRGFFNQAAAGIAETDLTGRFLLVNQRYCEMVDRSQHELLQMRIQDITHPQDLEATLSLFERAVHEGIPFAIEKRYIRPDGSEIWVRNHVALVRDRQGKPQSVLAVSQDITDRKKAETAMQIAQEGLKIYAGKLEQSNKELEHFATIASHDLQEPLRKVMMFSDHLKDSSKDVLNAEALDDIERMQRATRRMQSQIDALLDLSRVSRRGKAFQELDLADILTEVLADLHFKIKESGGRVELGPLTSIEGDPSQIQQLLENLISNALKFHREGVPPIVKVAAEPIDDRYCRIRIEDNGIGIKEEHKERIFNTFVRLHGMDAYPGTGIGLTIVRKIVERHGGSIAVRSIPGEGSVFIVKLPLGSAHKTTDGAL
jgi:PAS domain S-box-containing protein